MTTSASARQCRGAARCTASSSCLLAATRASAARKQLGAVADLVPAYSSVAGVLESVTIRLGPVHRCWSAIAASTSKVGK